MADQGSLEKLNREQEPKVEDKEKTKKETKEVLEEIISSFWETKDLTEENIAKLSELHNRVKDDEELEKKFNYDFEYLFWDLIRERKLDLFKKLIDRWGIDKDEFKESAGAPIGVSLENVYKGEKYEEYKDKRYIPECVEYFGLDLGEIRNRKIKTMQEDRKFYKEKMENESESEEDRQKYKEWYEEIKDFESRVPEHDRSLLLDWYGDYEEQGYEHDDIINKFKELNFFEGLEIQEGEFLDRLKEQGKIEPTVEEKTETEPELETKEESKDEEVEILPPAVLEPAFEEVSPEEEERINGIFNKIEPGEGTEIEVSEKTKGLFEHIANLGSWTEEKKNGFFRRFIKFLGEEGIKGETEDRERRGWSKPMSGFFEKWSETYEEREKQAKDFQQKEDKTKWQKGLGTLKLFSNVGKIVLAPFFSGYKIAMYSTLAATEAVGAAKEQRLSGEQARLEEEIAYNEAWELYEKADIGKNMDSAAVLNPKNSEDKEILNELTRIAEDESLMKEEKRNKRRDLLMDKRPEYYAAYLAGEEKITSEGKIELTPKEETEIQADREKLQQAYKEGLPEFILKRLEKGPEVMAKKMQESGGEDIREFNKSFLQKLAEKSIAWRFRWINGKIGNIEDDDSLSEDEKKSKIDNLLWWNDKFLKDTDRMIGGFGAIDTLSYGLKTLEVSGKVASAVFITQVYKNVSERLYAIYEHPELLHGLWDAGAEKIHSIIGAGAGEEVIEQVSDVASPTPEPSPTPTPKPETIGGLTRSVDNAQGVEKAVAYGKLAEGYLEKGAEDKALSTLDTAKAIAEREGDSSLAQEFEQRISEIESSEPTLKPTSTPPEQPEVTPTPRVEDVTKKPEISTEELRGESIGELDKKRAVRALGTASVEPGEPEPPSTPGEPEESVEQAKSETPPIEYKYLGGGSIWAEAENQIKEHYADALDKYEAGTDEYKTNSRHVTDAVKDVLAKAVAEGRQAEYGLGGVEDANVITKDQLGKIKWDKVFEAVGEKEKMFGVSAEPSFAEAMEGKEVETTPAGAPPAPESAKPTVEGLEKPTVEIEPEGLSPDGSMAVEGVRFEAKDVGLENLEGANIEQVQIADEHLDYGEKLYKVVGSEGKTHYSLIFTEENEAEPVETKARNIFTKINLPPPNEDISPEEQIISAIKSYNSHIEVAVKKGIIEPFKFMEEAGMKYTEWNKLEILAQGGITSPEQAKIVLELANSSDSIGLQEVVKHYNLVSNPELSSGQKVAIVRLMENKSNQKALRDLIGEYKGKVIATHAGVGTSSERLVLHYKDASGYDKYTATIMPDRVVVGEYAPSSPLGRGSKTGLELNHLGEILKDPKGFLKSGVEVGVEDVEEIKSEGEEARTYDADDTLQQVRERSDAFGTRTHDAKEELDKIRKKAE